MTHFFVYIHAHAKIKESLLTQWQNNKNFNFARIDYLNSFFGGQFSFVWALQHITEGDTCIITMIHIKTKLLYNFSSGKVTEIG